MIYLLVLLTVLASYLILSTANYAFQKKVTDGSVKAMCGENFFHSGISHDRVALIESPADAMGIRLELLKTATEKLDIVCMLIGSDDSSAAFGASILEAADRGVKVRLILDGTVGLKGTRAKNMALAFSNHPNIQFKKYNPVRACFPWSWNAILHDKFIIADRCYLLLGGRNIEDRYFNPATYSGSVTNDRDVFITSPEGHSGSINEVATYMNLLWEASCTKHCPPLSQPRQLKAQKSAAELARQKDVYCKENPQFFIHTLEDYKARTVSVNGIKLIHNPVNPSCKEPWLGYQLRAIARCARKSVIIQTPYATAHKKLLSALTEVGQKVDIFWIQTNSAASTPNLLGFASYYSHRKKFLATAADLYEYQSNDSIHTKTVLIDSRLSIVGSFNLDDRSMYIATETMLVIDSPEFASQVADAVEVYRAKSLKVGKNNTYTESSVEQIPVSAGKWLAILGASFLSRIFRFLV